MKGINIWNADTFQRDSACCTAGIKRVKDDKTVWVISRPIGYFNLRHRLRCAIEVFNGRVDIIRFYKQ